MSKIPPFLQSVYRKWLELSPDERARLICVHGTLGWYVCKSIRENLWNEEFEKIHALKTP